MTDTRHCDQCEFLFINGIGCHEHGCPEAWRTNKECKWCGSGFTPEVRLQEFCPGHSCYTSYFGIGCDCEECAPIELTEECES